MKTYLILLLVIVSFVACKKGENGDQGPPGTANVLYSEWFTPDAYTSTMVFGMRNFTYEKAVPEITTTILDSGMVIVFGKLLGYVPSVWPANQVSQLPISLTYNQGGVTTDTWSALCSPQKITIRFVNDQNIYLNIATGHLFRYLIVPGGTETSGRRSVTDYQHMSYRDICAMYNIPE